jgi:hypothetical protein
MGAGKECNDGKIRNGLDQRGGGAALGCHDVLKEIDWKGNLGLLGGVLILVGVEKVSERDIQVMSACGLVGAGKSSQFKGLGNISYGRDN